MADGSWLLADGRWSISHPPWSEQGYLEAAWWVEANFHDPDGVKAWLKGRRPDLYDKLFPKSRELSPHLELTKQYNLPKDHGFHTHAYFSDYQVHLRSADRWVTLIERGRLKSLDNVEVRALASRYGNPDELLREDWRPEIPGINAPGGYLTDYGPNPWKTVRGVVDRVLAGDYDHFYPPRAGHQPSGLNATEH